MKPDCELLHQYAEAGDEAAFAEVVHRHISLVHASAVRLLNGNATMAQDVTQVVFTDLARKAAALSLHTSVAGWLHTSVRFAAANAVRSEQRRRQREQEASAMSDQTTPTETAWMQMLPLIDEAVGQLHEPERDAVLLRFFEEKSHREVGAALGLTENAARMRVERGLEKLRAHLARHGVTASVVILAATLSAHAASGPVPADLAAAVASHALPGTGLPAGGTRLAKSGLRTFFGAKAPVALAGSVAIVSATAAAFIFTQAGLGAGPSQKHSEESASPPPLMAPAGILSQAPAKLATAPDLVAAAPVAMLATTTTEADLLQAVDQTAAPLTANSSLASTTDAPPAKDTASISDNPASAPPIEPAPNPATTSPIIVPRLVQSVPAIVSSPDNNGRIVQWSPRVGGNGHYYLPLAEPGGISWSAAQRLAAQRGGHLAVVATRAENDFVFGLVNSPGFWKLTNNKQALLGPWLGATHSGIVTDMTYGWQWINNNDALSFTNWAPLEPRAHGDRLHFFAWGSDRSPTWDNDQTNALMPGFVMEFDQKPRTGPTDLAVVTLPPTTAQSRAIIVPRGTIPENSSNNGVVTPPPIVFQSAPSRTLPGQRVFGPVNPNLNNPQPMGAIFPGGRIIPTQ